MKKIFFLLTLAFLFTQESFSQCNTNITGVLNFCGPACDGIVTFTSTSGTPPYNLVVTGGPTVQYSSSYTWTNVCPGSYHYDVTDAALSCTDSGTVVVTSNPLPLVNIPGPVTICSGQSVTISASGASGYSWSPSNWLSSTTSATVIATPPMSVTYTVVGFTIEGCTSSATVTVIVNPSPAIQMSTTNPTCWTCCDGAINPSVTGGTPPYSYLWSTSATTPTLSSVCVGTYYVTVADGLGCTANDFASVDTGYSVTISYASTTNTPTSCYAPFTANFFIGGGTSGYSSNDSLNVYVNFGDGNDTSYFYPLSFSTGFQIGLIHTYQFPGNYSQQFIVTGPNGVADTATALNSVIVASSCGNIDGRLYIDGNSNCVYDIGETTLSGIPVQLYVNSILAGTSYSGNGGNYYFYVPINNYTIQPGAQLAYYGFTPTCPPSGQISVSTMPSYGNDFGVTCIPAFDLSAILNCPFYRPGFVRYIYPSVQNLHCQPVSGQAKLVISDPDLTVSTTSVTPDAVSGDTLIWNFNNINNTNGSIGFGMVGVMTSLTAPIGDTICVTLIVEPTVGDANVLNNTVTVCRPVSNSYDPNDKSVLPHGDVVAGSWLTYTVRFQNTGNDTAYNVSILDTISTNLDMNTFQPVASSHPYETYILSGNIVKFAFNNIMLVDSNMNEPLSHGWITYRIKADSLLVTGTSINNTAHIYFDFNPAVVTNTVASVIDNTVGVNESESAFSRINLSPNPATTELRIQNTEFGIESVEVFDVLGQKYNSAFNHSLLTIDVSSLARGIYFVKLRGEKEERVAKFVKQ